MRFSSSFFNLSSPTNRSREAVHLGHDTISGGNPPQARDVSATVNSKLMLNGCRDVTHGLIQHNGAIWI
jgi:hypothetical protein